jgi:hypothetical protein
MKNKVSCNGTNLDKNQGLYSVLMVIDFAKPILKNLTNSVNGVRRIFDLNSISKKTAYSQLFFFPEYKP